MIGRVREAAAGVLVAGAALVWPAAGHLACAGGALHAAEMPAGTSTAPAAPAGHEDAAEEADHGSVMTVLDAPPSTMPPPAGVTTLTWEELWAEGDLVVPEAGERLGTPGDAEFPDGTTAEEIALFFLDIADIRARQPRIGTIRPELDGKRVRIAGFATPVGFDERDPAFLLMPEFGEATYPPPPPNQIIHVHRAEGEFEPYELVWLTGTLRADPVATVLADVGYRMEDAVVEPYR